MAPNYYAIIDPKNYEIPPQAIKLAHSIIYSEGRNDDPLYVLLSQSQPKGQNTGWWWKAVAIKSINLSGSIIDRIELRLPLTWHWLYGLHHNANTNLSKAKKKVWAVRSWMECGRLFGKRKTESKAAACATHI